ncbi:MAG: uracil-DNA glycosylase [Alphaproteobacteria bacterium]|nr:uracil-DNA glycosylase [Alphaproteobacteria bacterium]
MNTNGLRDLDLAGVRWELAETPTSGGVKTPMTTAPAATADTRPDVHAPRGVVPPSAPVVVDGTVDAAGTTDMASLGAAIAAFNHPLRPMATNVVCPHAAPNSCGLVIVTDIPGADDDASGRILSGGAGDLMDKMLAAIGLSRDNVSIVPLLFWRTPGGRSPTDEALKLARPFVDRALELLHPRVILTLGTAAAAQIAGARLPGAHGVAVPLDGGCVAMPIYHPNFLLLKPAAKRDVWTALQQVQNLLKTVEK